jgi:hypothetical protein
MTKWTDLVLCRVPGVEYVLSEGQSSLGHGNIVTLELLCVLEQGITPGRLFSCPIRIGIAYVRTGGVQCKVQDILKCLTNYSAGSGDGDD